MWALNTEHIEQEHAHSISNIFSDSMRFFVNRNVNIIQMDDINQ